MCLLTSCLKCLHFPGASDELGELGSGGLDLFRDDGDRAILFQVLRCIIDISQKLGKPASAVFYESFVGKRIVTFEETVSRLLKILETGYDSSVTALNISQLGADAAREKELTEHKILRTFSINMLLSLQDLNKKASSWAKVLNIVESYLQFLVPHKSIQHLNTEITFSVHTSTVCQATSQIAKVMFEGALDVLLFLSYLVKVSGQVSLSLLLIHLYFCRSSQKVKLWLYTLTSPAVISASVGPCFQGVALSYMLCPVYIRARTHTYIVR